MRSIFCAATVFTLLLLCSITASPASGVSEEFKVTEVFLKADDGRPTGPCPLRVTFRGYITANGPGTIKYTFTRSDGATGPVYIMEFKRAGTQAVMADWTLGDPRALPRYAGWQAVKVLSPVEIESNHETGSFEINCGGTDVSQTREVNRKGSGDQGFVSPTASDSSYNKAASDNNAGDSGRLTAAYELALPAIADPQLLLFRTRLEKLKSLNDELELKLDRAPKSEKFDKQRLQAEFSEILKEQDLKKRNQRVEEFRARYEPQIFEQLNAAGIDVTTERQRMASLLGINSQEISQSAISNAQRMLAVSTVMEAVDGRPPVEAAPEFYIDEFRSPFIGAGTRGPAAADYRTGALGVYPSSLTILLPRSVQSLAFVTHYVPARTGAHRLRVSVEINDLDLYVLAATFFGTASTEAAITLRVFEDGRVVANKRVSLQRFYAFIVGSTGLNRRLPAVTLDCELNRPRTDVASNYLMAIEFEGLAGSSGIGNAVVQLRGRVGPFVVRTY